MSEFINFDNKQYKQFELYEDLHVNNQNKSIKLTGNFYENNLSKNYFSDKNIDLLQKTIISEIYKLTKGTKIQKQSEDELLIVMKSIYLQYSRNNEDNIEKQIDSLNNRVLEYCINNVYTNLIQYNKYIEDITSQQKLMEFPKNVNIKGDKGLMANHFF
jgi:hypothetical protein